METAKQEIEKALGVTGKVLKLKYHADPQHGWLSVPMAIYLKSGFVASLHSFVNRARSIVYLECDADASAFIKIMRERGVEIETTHLHTNRSSKIRSLESVTVLNRKLPPSALAVFEANPKAVIIDGDDDWYAAPIAHPSGIASDAGIKIISTFHSGHSGISKTGIVIAKRDLAKFKRAFHAASLKQEQVKGGKPNYSASEKPFTYKILVIFPTVTLTLEAKGTRYQL